MQASVTILLDYLCNTYLVAFVMCLIGSVLREVLDSINNTNGIDIRKILMSTIFSSFLMSAASNWITDYVPFAGYVFCCLIGGIWGFYILQASANIKVVMVFIKNILKHVTTPLGNAAKDTVEELEKNESTTQKKKKTTTAIKKKTDTTDKTKK